MQEGVILEHLKRIEKMLEILNSKFNDSSYHRRKRKINIFRVLGRSWKGYSRRLYLNLFRRKCQKRMRRSLWKKRFPKRITFLLRRL